MNQLRTRHFLCIKDVSADEIRMILGLTRKLKAFQKAGRKHHPLKGKVLAMIFSKSSTRTRISFEAGIYQLGGSGIFLNANDLQLGRGESVQDTARVMSRFVDGIMIRTFSQEEVETLARFATVPVINGLTDFLHPCQILSDLFTISEFRPVDRGLHVLYIGDGNNVANSWLTAAAVLGFRMTFITPGKYGLSDAIFDYAGLSKDRLPENIRTATEIRPEVVKSADIIYTDVWVSMGQEKEKEERIRAFRPYQVGEELLAMAKPGVRVMHCLPAHRGDEITDGVMNSPASIVFDQAENRLHLQKALMQLLMK
jgi:ornithine carbamoyltransferase